MKIIHLALILAFCFIQENVYAQESDVTDIPSEIGEPANVEAKNGDDVGIEGSGDPYIDENSESTTHLIIPKLEYILPPEINEIEQETNSTSELPCPRPCVCSIEGVTNNFVVDCSGYALTEFPSPLDSRITTLNLNNNKLTEIPKEISALKKLKVLNANNNSIMELAAGSVSELPDLMTLQLANNRLIDFPQDLKNSLLLTKLEEIDLGGNDIRTVLTPEVLSPFKVLRKITLPLTTSNISEDLCTYLKKSLEAVCIESCKRQIFECPEAPDNIEDDLFDATLPGMIAFDPNEFQKELAAENKSNVSKGAIETTQKPTSEDVSVPSASVTSSVTEFSLRNAVNNEPTEKVAMNSIVNAPTEAPHVDPEVKIGAKTADAKSGGGGVDKSVVGIIIAAMVVIVAVIAIKKNWSSISKKFSSTPRPTERTNTNGTSPEEVPLQDKTNDKSPV